jgi:CxxC motif-containing protein (DUF1111 family)
MKGPHWGWYVLIGVVALAPAGARVLTWEGFRRQALDPQMVQAGHTLFMHEWKPNDPLSGSGDGLGPVYNAKSCVECHHLPGPGGAGGLEHNVTTYEITKGSIPNVGVVHAYAVSSPPETLTLVNGQLPAVSRPSLSMLVTLPGQETSRLSIPAGTQLSQRNTPALYGDSLIDAIPDRVLISNEKIERLRWGLAPEKSKDLPVGRAARLSDGRIGHFGWKAQSADLASFVQAACANELGLGNPGQTQPQPLSNLLYKSKGYDLTLEQCDQITSFVASLPRPTERLPEDSRLTEEAENGKRLFHRIGCTDCHMPNVDKVEGLYSDLLLHDMGMPLEGGGSYYKTEPQVPILPTASSDGPQPGEWRTPPLWGVADSAPYLHDGRAPTLEAAIQQHGGQAQRSAQNFAQLSKEQQGKVIAFLKTLRAPQ